MEEQTRIVKSLKEWGTKFSGESKNEDAEDILEDLQDFKDGSEISDRAILNALPCILSGKASRWYKTIKRRLKTWDEFCRAFRHQFMGEYDREDLLDDLRRRTQGKGEKIVDYLASLMYIESRFKRPPLRKQMVDIAYRNLLPEYRKAMSDKLVEGLEDIERYGRRWERQKDLDRRYVPPPPADKMTVPGAAFVGTVTKPKVATVVEEEEVAAVKITNGQTKNNKRNQGKKKSWNKGDNSKEQAVLENQGSGEKEVMKMSTVQTEAEFIPTYAAMVQGGYATRSQQWTPPRMENSPGFSGIFTSSTPMKPEMGQNRGLEEYIARIFIKFDWKFSTRETNANTK